MYYRQYIHYQKDSSSNTNRLKPLSRKEQIFKHSPYFLYICHWFLSTHSLFSMELGRQFITTAFNEKSTPTISNVVPYNWFKTLVLCTVSPFFYSYFITVYAISFRQDFANKTMIVIINIELTCHWYCKWRHFFAVVLCLRFLRCQFTANFKPPQTFFHGSKRLQYMVLPRT